MILVWKKWRSKMNLLINPWIPVRTGSEFKQITYKELLCSDQPELQVSLPRDDLELACIQMLAALTQVVFIPEDKPQLRARIKAPMSEDEFGKGVEEYLEWFDLEHPKWPFMQVLEPGTNEPTPIQKLFPGLPAGNNHAFFNSTDECLIVCPSCASIGIFNLCTHTPNLSGKHKGGLRGNAPISTTLYDSNIRKMVWLNVLEKNIVENNYIGEQTPTWINPIKQGLKIPAGDIGLARGLFWTPLLIKLQTELCSINCACCGINSGVGIRGFLLGSDFMFEVIGLWPHPYSPRQLNIQKIGNNSKRKPDESTISFRNTEPAWTQFSEVLFDSPKNDNKPGYIPAAVVAQFNDMYKGVKAHVLIGGYRNKQAAILQRRHELYTLPVGWNDDFRPLISEIIAIGIQTEKILADKVLFPFVKGDKKKNEKGVGAKINMTASTLYFQLSEPLIHQMLRESNLKEFSRSKAQFLEDLYLICFNIFERVTQPYAHKPEIIGTIALARVKMRKLMKNLIKEHTQIGGVA
jgi:CRISPR system Cascade subunit CasA